MSKLSVSAKESVGKVYYSHDVTIPENMFSGHYFEDVLEKLQKTGKTIYLLLEVGDGTFWYWDELIGTRSFGTKEDLEKNCVSPNFISFLHFNKKFDDNNGTPYQEIDLIEKHPEILPILFINSEQQVRNFVSFLINDLDIVWHPDDNFADYLRDDKIIDANGRTINVDKLTVKFISDKIELCFDIVGDEFYTIGHEISLEKLGIVKEDDVDQKYRELTKRGIVPDQYSNKKNPSKKEIIDAYDYFITKKQAEFDEDEDFEPRQNAKKIISQYLGEENIYSGSADWGGIPVWTVKGDLFVGTFVIIDDNNDVVLMTREFDEETEENIDVDIMTVEASNINQLLDLINKAIDIKNSPSKVVHELYPDAVLNVPIFDEEEVAQLLDAIDNLWIPSESIEGTEDFDKVREIVEVKYRSKNNLEMEYELTEKEEEKIFNFVNDLTTLKFEKQNNTPFDPSPELTDMFLDLENTCKKLRFNWTQSIPSEKKVLSMLFPEKYSTLLFSQQIEKWCELVTKENHERLNPSSYSNYDLDDSLLNFSLILSEIHEYSEKYHMENSNEDCDIFNNWLFGYTEYPFYDSFGDVVFEVKNFINKIVNHFN